mmetsp:Transcript_20925/g.49617  ORF Transcript_20925/g.49617 Transcript_20925/m.49617 type:complete len:258 (-) Transcript_20925:1086-1859(-)
MTRRSTRVSFGRQRTTGSARPRAVSSTSAAPSDPAGACGTQSTCLPTRSMASSAPSMCSTSATMCEPSSTSWPRQQAGVRAVSKTSTVAIWSEKVCAKSCGCHCAMRLPGITRQGMRGSLAATRPKPFGAVRRSRPICIRSCCCSSTSTRCAIVPSCGRTLRSRLPISAPNWQRPACRSRSLQPACGQRWRPGIFSNSFSRFRGAAAGAPASHGLHSSAPSALPCAGGRGSSSPSPSLPPPPSLLLLLLSRATRPRW